MTEHSEAAFNQTFKSFSHIPAASDEILCAHMWEFHGGDDPQHEINSLLGVMANDEGAIYSDLTNGQSARYQTSSGHGIIALACSALSVKNPTSLYNNYSKTGILLKNPTPVHNAERDCFSVYFEYETSPELRVRKNPPSSAGGLIAIDPHSPEAQKKAKTDYKNMIDKWHHPDAESNIYYSEVDVNATLEHIAGIVVYQEPKEYDFSADTWKERLQDNKALVRKLAHAIDEWEIVAKKMSDAGIQHTPTITIYQYAAEQEENRLIHFPPTEQNIQAVKEAQHLTVLNPASVKSSEISIQKS